MTTHIGWQLVAFADELTDDLTPVSVGSHRLMLVRRDDEILAYASSCPHRGANLAVGGELRRNAVLCPFHGRRIELGEAGVQPAPGQMAVPQYPTIVLGPLVFARLSDDPAGECGFTDGLRELVGDRRILPAVNRPGRVPVDFVVENAFDVEHFGPVHDVPGVADMVASRHESGYLSIGGEFVTLNDPWVDLRLLAAVQKQIGEAGRGKARMRSGFLATAFSPTLVFTRFGSSGRDPVIITGALERPDGTTQVRVAVAAFEGQPLDHIVVGSKLAIEQDLTIWDNLDPEAPWSLDQRDAAVIAFREFCADFPVLPVRQADDDRVTVPGCPVGTRRADTTSAGSAS